MRRLLVAVLLVLLVLFAAFVIALPAIIVRIPYPTFSVDLSPYLTGKAAAIADGHKFIADVDVRRGRPDGFVVRADGRLLDWTYKATVRLHFSLAGATGSLDFSLDDTPWRVSADFRARTPHDWSFDAELPETAFSPDDPVVGQVLARLAPSLATNLACSAAVSLKVSGDSTRRRPVPHWTARGKLSVPEASLTLGERPLSLRGLRVGFGAEGIADHRDIDPLFPRIESVDFAGFTLSNVFASVRAAEKTYLVTETGAETCGGELRLYSLFLDPERLSAGATVFVDGVDAGEILSHVAGFRGDATGRLHGKLPLFLKDGRTLRMRNAYLYSTPGEQGSVRIADSRPILDNLALGGVPADTRDNLAKALADLAYDVLKIELRRGRDSEDSALELKLEGSATHGNTTVPVKLDVTFHGDFEQLVNTGIKLRR